MQSLRPFADEYFRSLNPIARRICEDVDSTREAYESAWDYLSHEEQIQVINESLIYPDAALRYSLSGKSNPESGPSAFPTLKIAYGSKTLLDETGICWRDEHSSPFSWKSASQYDIGIDNAATIKEARPVGGTAGLKKKYPAPPPKPPKPSVSQAVSPDGGVIDYGHHVIPQVQTSLSGDEHSPLHLQVLPKTGCEFLDNW